MKLKSNITIRNIGKERVLIFTGAQTLDYTKVISLNDTADFLIEQSLKNEFTPDLWIDLLCNNYEVTTEQATQDVQNLIKQLQEANVLDE